MDPSLCGIQSTRLLRLHSTPDFSRVSKADRAHELPLYSFRSFWNGLIIAPAFDKTRMSRALGALDLLSRAYRPSQAAHLAVSRFRGKCYDHGRVVLHGRFAAPGRAASSLLPTLCIHDHNTAPDCRKALRGLRFPSGVCGLFTTTAVSLGPGLGQRGSR